MVGLQNCVLGAACALSLVACTRSTTGSPDSGTQDLGAPTDMGVDVPITCGATEMLCHGACIDTNGDNSNCGHCDTICRSGVTCAAGACSCMAPMLGCGGSCIDPMTDPTNCGHCGN